MNNKITPRLLKGFRDFNALEAYKRDYLKEKIKEVFALYGFEPLETPAVEYLETFTGNIGEDEKLFFKFSDQGERQVALRYDQTVPTCRYVAMNFNEVVLPYKRYQIQTVWRAEKPQKGRYREFLQCDADIFGVKGPEADAEVIALTIDIYKFLGFKNFTVKINDRSLFRDVPYPVIVAIDKLVKIGKEGVIKEIIGKGYSAAEAETFLKRVNEVKPSASLKTIFSYLKSLGIEDKYFVFDPKIARSFSYSTGPIWEVAVEGFDVGSVLGGERFDSLVSRFSNQEVPGTGFGLGFDRTIEAMEQFGLLPEKVTQTKVLATVFSPELLPQTLVLVQKLRENKINTDLYTRSGDKLDKQLKYADKKGIPYVVILGEEEVKSDTVTLKDLAKRVQKTLSTSDLVNFLSTK